MGRRLQLCLLIVAFSLSGFALIAVSASGEQNSPAPQPSPPQGRQNSPTPQPSPPQAPAALGRHAKKGTTYYVRQTVGDDANDGKSAKTAWRSISKLSHAMHAGDTAYVGPGLYRDKIEVLNEGAPDARITFIADTTGQHTGDPPGVVMITGAEPVDESIFSRHSVPGVYKAKLSPPILGLTEMDGPQYRYNRVTQTKEYLVDKIPAVDVVGKQPSSWYYDENANVLYIHTSDGKTPATHEIEIIRRLAGISTLEGKRYLTVIGFTFRHMGDSGIYFYKESGDGIAINNTSYGSRQGIRVYNSSHITVYGNTLFRNENCGTYFVQHSTNGLFIGNISYENIKGVRWGSQSVNGVAIDNTLFDNLEAGISVEDVYQAILRRNKLVNNKNTQLSVQLDSEYDSDDNCFQNGGAEQSLAHSSNVSFFDRQKTLAEYQKAKSQDLHSREGGCGPLPEKIDVHKLHAETMTYTERARKILKEAAASSTQEPKPKD